MLRLLENQEAHSWVLAPAGRETSFPTQSHQSLVLAQEQAGGCFLKWQDRNLGWES
jgi:hypothetical protein